MIFLRNKTKEKMTDVLFSGSLLHVYYYVFTVHALLISCNYYEHDCKFYLYITVFVSKTHTTFLK